MIRNIVIAILLLILIGVGTGIYMWNKPHNKVENAKGIAITADALAKEYNADEKAADAKYLNKAIEVSGTISEIDKNQDGGTMAILQTSDPAAGIQCTMREKGVNLTKGQNVTIKGFCSGNGITGVSLTDCVTK
jgi:tRNA_anti-like